MANIHEHMAHYHKHMAHYHNQVASYNDYNAHNPTLSQPCMPSGVRVQVFRDMREQVVAPF